MLRIKDEDLNLTCVEEGKYKGVNTLIITGTYSPKLTACKYCQSHANDADEKKTHNSTAESWAIYFWFSYFHFNARFKANYKVVFIDCNALDYLPYKLIIIF